MGQKTKNFLLQVKSGYLIIDNFFNPIIWWNIICDQFFKKKNNKKCCGIIMLEVQSKKNYQKSCLYLLLTFLKLFFIANVNIEN
jgi:hypothetical protein